MKIIKNLIFILLVFLLFFFLLSNNKVRAQNCNSKEECEKLISEYEQKLTEIRSQKNTLSSQIQYFDTQIYLTTLRIQDTENKIGETQKEIDTLTNRIEGLNTSLDYLTKLLIKKIKEGYKQRDVPFFNIFLDTERASDLFNRLKYSKIVQENDRRVAFQLQQAKTNFQNQKDLREEKKKELSQLKINLNNQQADLNSQKINKQYLLQQTQNDEKTYQILLSRAQAEYAAIQGIVAGAGTESKVRDVNKGETIATTISGVSCNSSGTHLHFIVQEGGGVMNPFSYLKSVEHTNCSGSSCGSGDGDQFNPSGSWDWPINPPISFWQGYGETWGVKNTWVGSIYSFHNGIDIDSSSNTVYAISNGELYRGTYSVGCSLSYTKLVHKDSNITTLYLHTYTQ
jgi:peptidoglycan hydrolase CwlO-like protein